MDPTPIDISQISKPSGPSSEYSDSGTLAEESALPTAEFVNKHGQRMADAEFADKKQEVANRGRLTWCIFFLIVAWMVMVLLIVAAVGFRHPEQTLDVTGTVIPTTTADWFVAFHLSDSVLMTLIGGTTANVLGLFLVVAQHLFPRRHREAK